jgi:hypothetical protein
MDLAVSLAIIFATFFGPIVAVWMTRRIDEKRASRQRQLDVFRTLMRTRRSNLSYEHVSALNLVEIEFDGVEAVQQAFSQLMGHLNTQSSSSPDWGSQRHTLLTKLLSAMATHLKYSIQQLDLLAGGYAPQGWQTTEEQEQLQRRLIIELLSSQRSLPVSPAEPTPPRPFPPAAPPPPPVS